MVKRKSLLWGFFRYTLLSNGKGAIETFRIFKPSNEFKEKDKEYSQDHEEKTVSKGKIDNKPPIFNDFDVENEVLGKYSNFKKRLYEDSKIVLIFGKRGSGKSALGLRIIENIKATTKRNCYVLGINAEVLPLWIKSITNIDQVESEGVVLVDEGALSFSARESMKQSNRELSKLMAIARHKNLTLIFITQNTGMLDKNILKLADSLMIKEGSLLQLEMERPEIKKFYTKTKEFLDNINKDKIKYFYLIDSDFEGLLKHSLPSFWTEKISRNKR